MPSQRDLQFAVYNYLPSVVSVLVDRGNLPTQNIRVIYHRGMDITFTSVLRRLSNDLNYDRLCDILNRPELKVAANRDKLHGGFKKLIREFAPDIEYIKKICAI
jgi:hypothetical protein